MTPDDGNDPGPADGLDEKAANALNATMVTAIGLIIGAGGLWVLWRFATAFWGAGATGGQGTGWMNLLNGAVFLLVGVVVTRFGVNMFRHPRQS